MLALRSLIVHGMRPNYALERSVKVLSERAAGARKEFTPAARWTRFARPA